MILIFFLHPNAYELLGMILATAFGTVAHDIVLVKLQVPSNNVITKADGNFSPHFV